MVCNLIPCLWFFIGYWILHGAAFLCGLFCAHSSSGAFQAIFALLTATAAGSIPYNWWCYYGKYFGDHLQTCFLFSKMCIVAYCCFAMQRYQRVDAARGSYEISNFPLRTDEAFSIYSS
jgi:hypothetical protein